MSKTINIFPIKNRYLFDKNTSVYFMKFHSSERREKSTTIVSLCILQLRQGDRQYRPIIAS